MTNSKPSADASIIGEGLDLTAVLPDFVKNHGLAAATIACANVLETVQGGAPVIPWKKNVAAGLTHNFGDEKTWISREGIVVFAGDYPQMNFLRVPTALNIFGAVAESAGYTLSMSPAAIGQDTFVPIQFKSFRIGVFPATTPTVMCDL